MKLSGAISCASWSEWALERLGDRENAKGRVAFGLALPYRQQGLSGNGRRVSQAQQAMAKRKKAAPDVDLRRDLKGLADRHYLQAERCYLAMQNKLAGNDVEKCCQVAEISKESDHVELASRPDYAAEADNYLVMCTQRTATSREFEEDETDV